jgi:acyl carrier protein
MSLICGMLPANLNQNIRFCKKTHFLVPRGHERPGNKTWSAGMPQVSAAELEVAQLIATAVNLELDPSAIDPEQPLYREGLGLDSIDLLEISLMVSKKYGFQIRSGDPDNIKTFSSLRALTQTIEARRTK